MDNLPFENTGFNIAYWAPFSESEFIAECLRDGIMKQYSGEERIEVLKLIKQLIDDIARNGPEVKRV